MQIRKLALSLLMLGTTTGALAGDDGDAQRAFDIPAQPLAQALKQFADQTGLQLAFETALTAGRTSPEVKGELSADEALLRLLKGTGLRYDFLDDRTVAVSPTAEKSTSRALPLSGGNASFSTSEEKAPIAAKRMRLARAEGAEATAEATGDQALGERGAPQESRLEEIIVTAQKREQRLQDVPISISAITAQDIERRGLVSAEDYLRGMPGVNQVIGSVGGGIVIRGIETNPVNSAANGRAVATYFGETSTTGLQGGVDANDIKLVDIERVEVLRGPQGTAFGNSALGGAVRTLPVAPKLDRFEGKVRANYSLTSGSGGDNHTIQGVVNLPLMQDRLAIRATGYRFEDSGYYRNVAASTPAFLAYSANFGALPFTLNESEAGGATRFVGGRIAALFRASDNLKLTLSYLTQKMELDGEPFSGTESAATAGLAPGLGTYEQAMWQVAPEHFVRGETSGVQDSDIDLANAVLEYDFGWSSLLATVSRVESGGTAINALNNGLPLSGRNLNDVHHHNSGEIRLATRFSGPWNFLVGVFAEEWERDTLFDAAWFGSLASRPANFVTPTPIVGTSGGPSELKQKAVFSEVSWEFLPAFTLTAGGRYYEYDRDNTAITTGIFGNATRRFSGDDSGTSFRSNLSYKPSDDAMIYAGWSEGFRLGNPVTGLPSGLCDTNNDGIVDGTNGVTIASTQFVEGDALDNYEVGAKLAMFDRRLSIAADVYRIKWDDMPFNGRAPAAAQGGCGLGYFANVGSATSEGIEVQANFQATDAFRVDVGSSWIRAELDQAVPAENLVSGARLPGSPKFTANLSLEYAFGIAGYDAFVRADSIYVGKFYSGFRQAPQTETGGYEKVDLTAQVAIDKFDVSLFVRNLTNADEFTLRNSVPSGNLFGFRLRPRTVGLQLDYNFGN